MKLTIVIILLALTIVFAFLGASNAISSSRIDSWLHRAKDAGNPQQVAEFLQNYKKALYDSNKVDGKYYKFFSLPGSYMPTYIRAIDGLIDRAQDLAKQNPTETSYQMGLINLEQDLGDLEATAISVWIVHDGGIWIISLALFLFISFLISLSSLFETPAWDEL